MVNTKTLAVIFMAIAITGCNRSVSALTPNTQAPPQPLPSVPSGDFEVTQLDPISGERKLTDGQYDPNTAQVLQADGTYAPADGNALQTNNGIDSGQTTVASIEPSSTEPLTREAVLGTWQVLSDNSDCRVFVAFTKWSGGYRAGSRRCQSAEVASITAWDVKGQQVVLFDGDGNSVAKLYSSGNDRYDGQTRSGQAISFSR